ncbi:hypothetical protein GE061_017045 [Apolygus lucorum]|uniref:Iron-binding zinc finger CDGSH type domain-containing protein n=1 Tax=Apolygus lucorum TaxID=248454 RepID=A0A8S9XHY8_APOLU|nr:hypothetical protein GE061_017045 [Apolygus lucorum]
MSIFSKSYSSKIGKGEKKEESVLPKNLLEDIHSASSQPENGAIYDKKPFKIELNPEKTYNWCLCGQSKNQPFCDGTHKSPYLKIKLKPIRFKVAEKKDYWLFPEHPERLGMLIAVFPSFEDGRGSSVVQMHLAGPYYYT